MRRLRSFTPIIWLVVALILVVAGLQYKSNTDRQVSAARATDKTITNACTKNCLQSASLCAGLSFSSDVAPRVMGDREDAVLRTTLAVPDKLLSGVNCVYNVDLQAPDFNTQSAASQSVTLSSDNRTAALSWILSPKNPGTWIVALNIQADSVAPISEQIGVTVRNQFGLTAGELEILSTLAEILAPILTLLSIFDLVRRLTNRDKQKADGQAAAPGSQK